MKKDSEVSKAPNVKKIHVRKIKVRGNIWVDGRFQAPQRPGMLIQPD